MRYYISVIVSFANQATATIWRGEVSKHLPSDIQRTAYRKLTYLNAAQSLNDLLIPPGNRLEQLKGDRAGEWSIRINDQWRITFKWTDAGPEDVGIEDYH